jgi:hypothetical protein
MAGFDHSVLTDVGWDALTDAEAGQHIEYIHMEAGDGYAYGGDAELFTLTALKHKIMNFPITSFSNDGEGQLTLIGVISSQNVTSGFHLREIGVKCTVDSGPEILYAVSNAGDDADYIPAAGEGGTVIQSIQVIIKIDRASNVTIVVQPGLDVTCQNIGPGSAGAGWFRDKIGQICWFKRVTSPKGTVNITETSDLISIDVPVVDEDYNLDMWVALGNPDIFPNFSTIQNALNYLTTKQIRPGFGSTITVMPGVWTNQDMTKVNHPHSTQIKIIGTIGTVQTVTSVSGSEAAVTLTSSNIGSQMNVGDYFLYKNTTSTAGKAISGCWRVAAETTNTITFDAASWGTFPSLGGVSGGTITPLRSVIKAKSGQGGIEIRGPGLGLLKQLCFVGAGIGSGTAEGIEAERGETFAEVCGAREFGGAGFDAQLSGRLNCLNCGSSGNYTGYQAGWGGVTEATGCSANSNQHSGFRAEGGYMRVFTGNALGNGDYGFVSSNDGTGLINELLAGYNNGHGVSALYNSSITSAGGSNTTGSNGDDGISLHVASVIIRTAGPAIAYDSSNIATNSLSNDGCWFQP